MSLEDKIEALIKALDVNTAALTRSIEVRVEAIDVAKNVKAAADKPADKPKATDKPTETKKDAEKPAGDEAYAGLKEIVADYLGATDRKEERAARQEKVVALLKHEKIAKKDLPADAKSDLSNIAVENIPLFKDQMKKLKEKGDLTTPETEEVSLV